MLRGKCPKCGRKDQFYLEDDVVAKEKVCLNCGFRKTIEIVRHHRTDDLQKRDITTILLTNGDPDHKSRKRRPTEAGADPRPEVV